MTNLSGRMPTKGKEYSEHDSTEERKRVATYVDGNSVSYEDGDFTSGDSPIVLDVLTDMGRLGHEGQVVNDGPGDIQVEISFNGTAYGGIHTLREGEVLNLSNLKVARIRLTYVDDAAYRAMIS